jgi:cyclophilin family peptidyl-prolyl cis-trans isomerase/HEAT repeat protein
VADRIRPLLDDHDATVRAQAADALAQAHQGRPGGAALDALIGRARTEKDPTVLGALARSIGRLRLTDAREGDRERALIAVARGADGGWPPAVQLTGTVLGMESTVRLRRGSVGGALLLRLNEAARYRGPGGGADVSAARVREVALLALSGAGALTPALTGAALDDADARVRLAAASQLARRVSPPETLVDRALGDPSAQVRLEGVRGLAASARGRSACARLESHATDDPDLSVRLAAIDALAAPCPAGPDPTALLFGAASSLERGADAAWHAPAHALVALASVDRRRASTLLGAHAAHPNPFVRTWASRAATILDDRTVLRMLTSDPDANTRAAALDGLGRTAGRQADGALLAALASDDAPQVLLAVVPHLAATESVEAVIAAAVGTLDRLKKTGAETLRDPRLALLDLVGLLGDERSAPALEPFLYDYDEVVADRAAEVLTRWTWQPYLGAARRGPRLPLPTPEELRAMAGSDVVLHMRAGGVVRIRLMPREAPMNVFRLFEMVRRGDLDGLTFHRVVPNFVIQGGSPLANEYAGHGAFTRDEVGPVVQWRGTVGVSTRGRDTGDGQIYVNLVDNVRLDHDYTILGVVTDGMDVVDAVREGDVIERAGIEPAAR